MTSRFWRYGTKVAVLGFLLLLGMRGWADQNVSVERMRRDITYLASDECEGRGPGTEGLEKAAKYIAQQFTLAGLKPGGIKDSYFQPFTVSGTPQLDGPNTLKLKGPEGKEIELKLGDQFQVLGFSGSGKVQAPLVFVGFGVKAKDIGYDDYQGQDVAGKIVVLLRHTPRWDNPSQPFDGPRKNEHADLEKKQALAEVNKAAGVLLINDRTEGSDKLLPFSYVARATPSSIPAVHVHREVIEPLFQTGLGKGLVDVEKSIDKDLKPRSGPLSGWSATVQTSVKKQTIPVKNVIGVLPGDGPLANETVVVGAHYDHLGYGGRGSRNKEPNKKEIHHGADDNASGTTTLIELAHRFGHMKNRQGRRLVFIAFSAEEMGLLGSRHYCNKEPLFPLENTVAMVNLDMVGRLQDAKDTPKPKLIVEGTGTAKDFDKLIDQFNGNPGFQLTKKPGGTGPSDHDSFYRKKIPVFFFWTGTHSDYHKPTDTSDKINVSGMARIADLAEKTIAHLAYTPTRPEYVHIASSMSPGAGKGPRLGIIPNYEDNQKGLQVGGVQDDGPAAKAGIKAGDQIIEIAGKPVTNITTYMALMAQQQSGQPLEIAILRDGKKLTLKVTPK